MIRFLAATDYHATRWLDLYNLNDVYDKTRTGINVLGSQLTSFF